MVALQRGPGSAGLARRRGRRRRAFALLAVLAGLVAPSTALAQEGGAPDGAAAEECSRVEVLLLVDESASLRSTDPAAQRVAAADGLIRSLSATAQASGGTIGLTVAGFGSATEEVGRATLPADTDAATGLVAAFADRNEARNTDYVLALRYAVEHFAALPDVPGACKRVVWFTDGAYSIDDPAAPGIATYTTSTDASTIERELEGQVCGPLPPSSLLPAPLSAQVWAGGFGVQLVDLRAAGGETAAEREARAATDPVIERLLTGGVGDPCRVPGDRVEAGQASALTAEFFAQGQIALGRRPLPCERLADGVPAPLVRAATARTDAPDEAVTLAVDGRTIAEGEGFATFANPQGSTPDEGALTAAAPAGLAACFAELAVVVEPAGALIAVPGSQGARVRLSVRGAAGGADAPGPTLGPEAVAVSATVDGAPAPATWVPDAQAYEVELGAVGTTPPQLVVAVADPDVGPIGGLATEVALGATPPLPRVVWEGPSTLEGAGGFDGRLTVVPAAATGATLCVALGPATTSAPDVALVVGEPEVCGRDDAPFSVAARLDVGEERNGDVVVAVPYTATFQPVGTGAAVPLDGEGQVGFPTLSLTRPPDTVRSVVLTASLVVLSALVPLLLLLVLINLQRRLPDPRGRTVAVVALTADGGALEVAGDVTLGPDDVHPLDGDRRTYRLPRGLTVTSERTTNPFAEMTVLVTSDGGPVTAVPWMAAGPGRAVEVPAGFEHLVLLRSEPGSPVGEAVVVSPPGATPATVLAAAEQACTTSNGVWSRVRSVLATSSLP